MGLFQKIKTVHLELTYSCNHRCFFCPQATERNVALNEDAVFNLLEKMTGLNLCVLSGGEALLWPGINTLFEKFLKQENAKISMVTNGSLFNSSHFALIAQQKFKMINISFNAADEETYTFIHGRTHIYRVLDNIQRLFKIRSNLIKAGKTPPYVQVSCVFSKRNARTIHNYAQYFAGKVDAVVLQELMHYPQIDNLFQEEQVTPELWESLLPDIANLRVELERKGTRLKVLTRHPLPPFPPSTVKVETCQHTDEKETEKPTPRNRFFCAEALTELMINAKGRMSLGCCNSRHQIGFLGQTSLDDIENSKEVEDLRGNIKRGNYEYCPLPRLQHKCHTSVAIDIHRKRAKAVVVVSPSSPWPLENSQQIRTHNILKWLKMSGYRTVLITLSSVDSIQRPINHDTSSVVDEFVVAENSSSQTTRWDCRGIHHRDAEALRVIEPYRGLAWCSNTTLETVNSICRDTPPLAVIISSIFMTPIFQAIPDRTLRIIDSYSMFFEEDQTDACNYIMSPFICSKETMRTALLSSDIIMTPHVKQQQLFKEIVPEKNTITVGLSYDNPVQPIESPRGRPIVLFVGSSNVYDQVGLQHFLKTIWPIVLNDVPTATLRIAGSICDSFELLGAGVELIKHIQETDALFTSSMVVINPTRYGSCFNAKSSEAIAHGKPLVSWPDGVKYLPASDNLPFIEVKTEKDFANAITSILTDASLRKTLENYAYSYLVQHFSSPLVFKSLSEVLARAC